MQAGIAHPHTHLCKLCATEWAHSAPDDTSMDQHYASHKCPVCGCLEFVVHRLAPQRSFIDGALAIIGFGIAAAILT